MIVGSLCISDTDSCLLALHQVEAYMLSNFITILHNSNGLRSFINLYIVETAKNSRFKILQFKVFNKKILSKNALRNKIN